MLFNIINNTQTIGENLNKIKILANNNKKAAKNKQSEINFDWLEKNEAKEPMKKFHFCQVLLTN